MTDATASPPNLDEHSRGRWFRANLWLHRWSSLVATPMFLVLCVTGTVLIFHEELDHALGYEKPVATTAAPAHAIADGMRMALAQNPGHRPLSVGVRQENANDSYVMTGPQDEAGFEHAKFILYDRSKGELTEQKPDEETITGFLLTLHAQWFLGPLGELVGAFVALLILVSLMSGMVVYAPYMRRIAFGVLRVGRGQRLLQLDLHNFIGAVVLGWTLLVSVTGLLLGLGTVALGLWQLTELNAVKAAYESRRQPGDPLNLGTTPDQALAAAALTSPGWTANAAYYPGSEYATKNHYTVLLFGSKGIEERLFRIALVDADTGKVAEVRELPWYLKLINLSQPLHFGDYGGMPLKILWTVCTWGALFITGNGAWLWWSRRKRRVPEDAAARAGEAVT